jgi:Protein of unknown function (DUF998)
MKRKFLLTCGIVSSLLYAAMNIGVALQWPAYGSLSQTVSELSAIDAPTRWTWVPLGYLYTVLMTAFGWGVRLSSQGNHPLRVTGGLLIAYGITGLAWPLFPMHLREVVAAGGATLTDTLHIAFSALTVVVMLLAMGFGAVSLSNRFRWYSIGTMGTLLLFGVLTSLEAPDIDAGLPTPLIGLWERINIGVFLLWVVVLAVLLLQRPAMLLGRRVER